VCREEDPPLVLAVDSGTLLTAVFPLGDSAEFSMAFADAVAAALTDLGVAAEHVDVERTAAMACPLVRLVDKAPGDVLDAVEFICGTETPYHSDVRVVQRNLNDFPHPHPPDYTPEAAVRRLFGVARRSFR
jgi:hypothetical protein